MCRIASPFLLQRLKGSMSGNASDLNNIETRAAIKFSPLQSKVPKKIHAFWQTFGKNAPSYATVRNWVTQFKRDFSTCDAPHPGRPKTVTTPQITDQIHELILEDRPILAKSIAEQLGISGERVGSIIHEDLDLRKLSAKWVSTFLNADQKRQRCHSTEQYLECFRSDPNYFLSRLVTMDETWLYHCDPEIKPLGTFSPRFFGIKTPSSAWIIFQWEKLSTRSINHLCWCNGRAFWRKNAAGRSPRGFCLAR